MVNKNTIKTSWCTTANLGAKIKQHNEKIMRSEKKKENEKNTKTCNCGRNDMCPLMGKCLTRSVVYNVKVEITGRKKQYIIEKNNLEAIEKLEKAKKEIFKPKKVEYYTGLTEGRMKDRIYKHHYDFRHRNFEKRTSLSKYIWKLKDHYYQYNLEWKIMSLAKSYNPSSKSCNLCTKEKLFIIFKPEISTLNERKEILKKCMHRRKWLMQEN